MTNDASPENLRKFLESDDHAMVRMGLSMAKGSGVPEELHLTLLGILLWDSEEGNREAAKDLVDGIGIKNIPESRGWLESLDNLDVDVRRAAVAALGKSGDARVAVQLIKALGDEDENIRCHAAEALGNIGDARAVDPLIEALADESEYVCSAAVEALGNIGDVRAVEPLTERSLTPFIDRVHVRENIAEALGQLGPYTDSNNHGRASDWLFEYFTYSSWNEDGVRVAAAEALGKIGAAEGLLEVVGETGTDEYGVAWSHPDPEERGSALEAVATALEESSGKPIVEYLIDALEVEPAAAAWMLGYIGDRANADVKSLNKTVARAVEPLIAALGKDELKYGTYISAYEAIGEALGKIGDARAVEPLIEALGDEDGGVRRAAAWALGEIGDVRAVEPLSKALGDEDEHVREAATKALTGKPILERLIDANNSGKIGESTVELLVKALENEDESVRWIAAEALVRIGDARAVELLIEALRDGNSAAAGVLEKLGKPAVEQLIEALGDDISDVREHAAKVLGNIGDTRAVEPLLEVLNDNSWWVRRSAVEALGNIGDAHAVEPFIKLLEDDDWDVAEATKEALRKLGHEVE